MRRMILRFLSRINLFDLDWYDEMQAIKTDVHVQRRESRDFAHTLNVPPLWLEREEERAHGRPRR